MNFGHTFFTHEIGRSGDMFFFGVQLKRGTVFGIDKWENHEMNVCFFLAMFDGEVAFREWGIRWI